MLLWGLKKGGGGERPAGGDLGKGSQLLPAALGGLHPNKPQDRGRERSKQAGFRGTTPWGKRAGPPYSIATQFMSQPR